MPDTQHPIPLDYHTPRPQRVRIGTILAALGLGFIIGLLVTVLFGSGIFGRRPAELVLPFSVLVGHALPFLSLENLILCAILAGSLQFAIYSAVLNYAYNRGRIRQAALILALIHLAGYAAVLAGEFLR